MWLRAGKQDETHAEFQSIFAEIESGSDRAAGIVAAACVEDQLAGAIQSKMEYDEVIIREMFRSSGPLGSFSAKINLGYLMRLYGKDTKNELDTIKEIRNSFAHRPHTKDFEVQRLRDLSSNLSMSERLDVHWIRPPKMVEPAELKVGDTVIIGVGLRNAASREGGPSILPEIAAGTTLSPRSKYIRACQFHVAVLFMIMHKGGPADVSHQLSL
jgi:hypothetical protein